MGLAQQFLAGRSPHRVLVGDAPLDSKFSEALERAVTARAKNETGLIERGMMEEGALARSMNQYRQLRQASLEDQQYKEALALAQAKAEGTDAIIDAIFPDPDAKLKQYYENKKIIDDAKVDEDLDKLIKNQTSIENQRAQIINAQTSTDLNSIRTDNFLDSLDSDSQ